MADRCKTCGGEIPVGTIFNDEFCSTSCFDDFESKAREGRESARSYEDHYGYDHNDIDGGRYDDDPSPYDGTYSEE
jgi:hypothetical protein